MSITISGSAVDVRNAMAALLSGMALTSANVGSSGEAGGVAPKATGRRNTKNTEPTPNISSGADHRTDPNVSEADAAQDAADEANENKIAEPEKLKLTHDHVKKMLGGYVMAYGMPFAQEDGPGYIGVAKISDLKDDQKVLAKAVIDIATAIEKNPKGRDLSGDGLSKEKTEELKPIIKAAQAILAA